MRKASAREEIERWVVRSLPVPSQYLNLGTLEDPLMLVRPGRIDFGRHFNERAGPRAGLCVARARQPISW